MTDDLAEPLCHNHRRCPLILPGRLRRLLPSWRPCCRLSWWSLLPSSSSVWRCRCSRFTCIKDLASAPLWSGSSPAHSSAASLLSRFWAGHYADSRGAKRAAVTGLLVATAAGLLYLLSLGFVRTPEMSVTILLLGRAVLGMAESFIVTGAFTWGLALVGPQNTGKIMAWIGTAL